MLRLFRQGGHAGRPDPSAQGNPRRCKPTEPAPPPAAERLGSTLGRIGVPLKIHPPTAMKKLITLLFVAFTLAVHAADAVPPKCSLSIGSVYESKPERPEWVFILGGTGAIRGGETVCRSPEALKKLLKGLPRGSTLDWSSTCEGESKALTGHLEDLKKICTEAGIVFTIHPTG